MRRTRPAAAATDPTQGHQKKQRTEEDAAPAEHKGPTNWLLHDGDGNLVQIPEGRATKLVLQGVEVEVQHQAQNKLQICQVTVSNKGGNL